MTGAWMAAGWMMLGSVIGACLAGAWVLPKAQAHWIWVGILTGALIFRVVRLVAA